MLSISTSDEWRAAHPGAVIGLLEVSGVDNSRPSRELEHRKRETEARLRTSYQGFTRQGFLSLPVLAAYELYYKQFKKTYHVLLQMESIVLKGKSLPSISALVDSYFMAEMETFILTAGHDADKLRGSILMDVSREGDPIRQMNGTSREIHAGDMIMRDEEGIRCSIIYGQDDLSAITSTTSRALFVAYVPIGVPADVVEAHLTRIEASVRLFSPAAAVEQRRLLSA